MGALLAKRNYIIIDRGKDSSDGKLSVSYAGDPGSNPGVGMNERGRDYQL